MARKEEPKEESLGAQCDQPSKSGPGMTCWKMKINPLGCAMLGFARLLTEPCLALSKIGGPPGAFPIKNGFEQLDGWYNHGELDNAK